MKKFLMSIATLFAMVILAGCGGESVAVQDNNTTDDEKKMTAVEKFKAQADKAHHLFTGCYEMQYDDACWANEEGLMVPTDVKLEYYTEAGFRGNIKGISDHPAHWHLNYTQYMKDDGTPPLLNLGSTGLYDELMWNSNVGEYIEYNTTAQFFLHPGDTGNEVITLITVYSEDYDGTENRRSVFNPGLVVFAKKYQTNDIDGYEVVSEEVKDYTVKADNFHNLPEGLVLKDCLYVEIHNPWSIVENDYVWTTVKSVVCGEGYGLVEMEIIPDDKPSSHL